MMALVTHRNHRILRKLAAVLLGTGVGWWIVVLGRGCAHTALVPVGIV